jgi:hypothetical protein
MERKVGTRAVEVETQSVQRNLNTSKTVTAEEDKALRMRHGVRVAPEAPLAQAAASGSELADELLVVEMQLLRAFRARGARNAAPRTTPAPSRTKDKIVRALRKKR